MAGHRQLPAATLLVRARKKRRVYVPRLPASRMQPPPDQHGLHEAACVDLADEVGHEYETVWYWWRQISGAVEMNSGYPRAVCEFYASIAVRAVFDKRGCIGD